MRVYLGLGTNLGSKEQNIHCAVSEIEKRIGKVISLSAFYATAPWGFMSDNNFLNAVVCVETSLLPFELLEETQRIERDMGRIRKSENHVYHDRLMDIDLLLYGNQIMETERLTIPHPLMTKRLFVMEPLAEIAPQLMHPIIKRKMADIKRDLLISANDVIQISDK